MWEGGVVKKMGERRQERENYKKKKGCERERLMPFILPGWRNCNMLEKKTIRVNWEKLNLPKM